MFASSSVTTDESSIGYGSLFQLCFLDNGDTGETDLRTGNISMSSLEPLLWVLLRLRSSLSLPEMNDSMGRREGRHASGDSEKSHVSRSCFCCSKKRRLSCTDRK